MTTEATQGAPAPVSGANATFAQAKAEALEAEAKAKPKSEAESPPAADPSEKPAKPVESGEQIRIKELTRRLREAERRNERLLKLAEERGQPPAQPAQPAQTEKTLKDFNYDTEQFAKHERERLQAGAAETAKQLAAQLREEEAASRRREKFEERVAAYAKANPEYAEDVGGEWACSKPMAEVIEESEEGPALAHYLAQNPDVASQMSRLSPAQAGRELAKLEARLVSERSKAAEKPVTKAPPPPPKIEGGDPGNIEKDPSKMTDAQFRKWREAAMARRR